LEEKYILFAIKLKGDKTNKKGSLILRFLLAILLFDLPSPLSLEVLLLINRRS